MSESFPMITNLTRVIPQPFTFQAPVPEVVFSPPNALRLVRRIGGLHPHFPNNPHKFTIPGRSIEEARNFAKAMSATVRWNQHRRINHNLPKSTSEGRLHHFKLEFHCPCKGYCNPAPNSRKSKHISARCGCLACFAVFHHIESDSLRVEWFWQHNHDPYSHKDMVITRAPKAVDNWLKERVESGLPWAAIHRLIRTPYISSIASAEIIPEGLRQFYDQFRYLRRKQVKVVAQRDKNVLKSLESWEGSLKDAGWNTRAVYADDGSFSFAFQSSWQKTMMIRHGSNMLMLDATHNSTSNYFLCDGKKISLWTFMIRDPIVGKGLPVAWAFTASAAEGAISPIIWWLRDSTGIRFRSIMSDCALAIANAVNSVYEGNTFAQFRTIMYSQMDPGQWANRLHNWALFYRTTDHQGVHTNNYTESWHRLLKSSYLPPPERLRIDEVVQILTDDVESHYRWAQMQVENGFAEQTTNRFQQRAKLLSESFTEDDLELLGIAVSKDATGFTISSFTYPMSRQYRVTMKVRVGAIKDQLTDCSCPHYAWYGSSCKHMYYLSRIHNLHVVEDTSMIPPPHSSTEPLDDTTLPSLEEMVGYSANNAIDLTHEGSHASRIVSSSDSDIEVVQSTSGSDGATCAYRPPTRAKRPNPSSELKPHAKRTRTTPSPSSRVQSQSAATPSTSKTPLNTDRLSMTMVMRSGDSPEDERQQKHNSLTSGLVALRRLVVALRLAKTRKEMAVRASPAALRTFSELGVLILTMVRVTPPTASAPPGRITAGTTAASRECGNDQQKLEWVVSGWEPLKLTWDLLTDTRGMKTQVLKTFTPTYMNLFRQRCYEAWSLVEENCPSVGKKVQNRW
ncbi:hypothetical protein PCANC_17726 [Puccinia coronata f. sp. avenae]|uniref:SWIM-type domain-containing protein n=1 Tax=Puccinia coronata f. sp. avenae TaxID=200324 RepID=A0A2N5U102_9BASI|nr:hypothetical protein PCANC_17726 [Puccinia coronata f. sp. avenae]